MSGHSKWATTKHKKAAIDAKRGKLFAKLIKNIEVAARTGGGDPLGNPTLWDAIYKAKKSSVPNDNIDRAVKRGSGAEAGGADYKEITYEGYAPNGVALYIQCLTDNRNRAAAEVRTALTRNGGNLADPGSVAYMFTRKGVVIVPKGEHTEDTLLEVVLDAGVRLAGALETAHQAGIMHRDIKPSNVLLTTTGRPALTDFGISMLQNQHASDDKMRALSIPWAAPEVNAGTTTGTVASEVWALGATLYTFAAGLSPFEHTDRAQNTESKMRARISQAKYRPIPGAQGYEPFDAVLRQSLSLRPESRQSSMYEFAEALRQLQRSYGYDVTPLDLVRQGWVAPAADHSVVRGPVITAVRPATRAAQRAELRANRQHEDSDGVLRDAPNSAVKSGLIGAGIAVLVLGGVIAAGFGLGWFG